MDPINTYTWKGAKILLEDGTYQQPEMLLMDMTEQQLKDAFEYCKTMLFNSNSKTPGRYKILKSLADQRDRCGIELFLRYIDTESDLSRFSLIKIITDFRSANSEAWKGTVPTIDLLFSGVEDEYSKLPLDLLLDGCLAKLGTFNRQAIKRAFILRHGIWLTPAELKDFTEYAPDGTPVDRLQIIRSRLNVKDFEKLYFNSKGLTYSQMRAMLTLRPNKQYSELTTLQLELLRNKILFELENEVQFHILAWENRMSQIDQVAQVKGFKIC